MTKSNFKSFMFHIKTIYKNTLFVCIVRFISDYDCMVLIYTSIFLECYRVINESYIFLSYK